jgi:hypothetical protein
VLSWPNISSKKKKTGPTGPSRIEEKRNEKRDIPVKNGIPQIRTDKCSTVFGPVSVYSVQFSVQFPFIPEKTKTDGKKRYTVADETGFIPSVFILAYRVGERRSMCSSEGERELITLKRIF